MESNWGYVIYGILGIVSAYIFYFFLGVVLQTSLPVVAVVSGSMDHGINEDGTPCHEGVGYRENFEGWWTFCQTFYSNIGLTKEQFRAFPFSDGFEKGDMPIVSGWGGYEVGDVIVYNAPTESAPIIHRIIKMNLDGTFQTKGDHNSGQNPYELSINGSQIYGKVIFIFPKLGYLKVVLTQLTGV